MAGFFGTVKSSVKEFLEDECMVSGAALAYYTIFALPPLLVLVFFIASLFGVSHATMSQVVAKQVGMPVQVQQQAGLSAGSTPAESGSQTHDAGLGAVVERQSSEADPVKALGPLSKVIGIGILIFSATGVLAQLQRALNRVWEVEPDPNTGGWKNFIVKRSLSLAIIIVVAFLLLVSLVLTTAMEEIVGLVLGDPAGTVGQVVGLAINTALSLAVTTVLFAAVYQILPDAEIRWRDTWVGAFCTAVLFVVGKELIGWYLRNANIGSAWGSAAGSMLALLAWVYYTSLIVLFGAELTQSWARQHGSGIVPAEGAVRVVEQTRRVSREEAVRGPHARERQTRDASHS
jgi:membrane protein